MLARYMLLACVGVDKLNSEQLYRMRWSRHLVSVHGVKPVRLSIAVRRVWPQFSRA